MLQLQSRKVTNFTSPAIALAGADINNDKIMEEGKRQKQIAGLLNEEMNTIFQRLGLSMIDGGMVSISSVKVTPDLLEARFYLSFFQVKEVKAALQKIEDRHHEIKKELAAKVRHQLRSIPVLKFFQDDTLDHVFKMEEIFKKIEDEKPPTLPAGQADPEEE
jgi:ribosome-binding factor A